MIDATSIMKASSCLQMWSAFEESTSAEIAMAVRYPTNEPGSDVDLTRNQSIYLGDCKAGVDGGWYRTQSIGPLTTSGQQFIHVYWYKAFGGSSGVITQGLSLMIDSLGKPVSTPPLHPHHAYIQPRVATPTFTPRPAECLLQGRFCPFGPNFISWGEDNLCPTDSRQWECMGKRISPRESAAPMSVEFIDDDLRPANSNPLKFWHNFVLHFSNTSANLTSLHIASARFTTLAAQGGIALKPFESFSIYSNRMPFAGTLLAAGTYVHHHFVALRRSAVLPGSLATHSRCGIQAWMSNMPMRTTLTGFMDNRALERCVESVPESVVCYAAVLALQGRKQTVTCRSWSFDTNSAFTMIAYYDPSSNHVDHMQWYLATMSSQGGSHFTQSLSTFQNDVFDLCVSRADVVHLVYLLRERALEDVAYALAAVCGALAVYTAQSLKSVDAFLQSVCMVLALLVVTELSVVLLLADLHSCIDVSDEHPSTSFRKRLLAGWLMPPLIMSGLIATCTIGTCAAYRLFVSAGRQGALHVGML